MSALVSVASLAPPVRTEHHLCSVQPSQSLHSALLTNYISTTHLYSGLLLHLADLIIIIIIIINNNGLFTLFVTKLGAMSFTVTQHHSQLPMTTGPRKKSRL